MDFGFGCWSTSIRDVLRLDLLFGGLVMESLLWIRLVWANVVTCFHFKSLSIRDRER